MVDAGVNFKGVPVSLIYSKGRDTFCGDAGLTTTIRRGCNVSQRERCDRCKRPLYDRNGV